VRSRTFLKLFGAALVIIVVATTTLDFAIRRAWQASLRQQIETALREKTALAALEVPSIATADLPTRTAALGKATNARVTVIDDKGVVLADSEADRDTMENHATRPEFQAALKGQSGSNTRRSRTLGIEFLYVAMPISGGAVRLAYPLAEIQRTAAQVRTPLLTASVLALLIAALLAAIAAQFISVRLQRIMRFAERIAAGDLHARLDDPARDEIAQLAAALDRTARQLETSFAELKRSRGELEVLLESMQDAVLSVDRDGRLLWVNGALKRLLNSSALIGAPLAETARDPDLLAAVRGALRGEVSHANARTLGAGRVFDVMAAPMPGGAAVAVLHDITQIEQVERTRRDFIANVSHELRTPLTSIQGYTETLLDADGSPGSREFLEIVRKNAARMARLTEDLLTLARVESGEQKLKLESVPAAELLAEAKRSLETMAQQYGVELRVIAPPELTVHADRDAVEQVFNNLVENALRYAPDGKRIELGAAQRGDSVEFFIRDFGPGIASEHLPRLFERFYRVDKARSRESGGTGLGLAIVKHIILKHGGSVCAESSLGHGATFYFSLPVVPVAVPA
jgi:two-component system phosphate regulon sensor histidine kinase PhoR